VRDHSQRCDSEPEERTREDSFGTQAGASICDLGRGDLGGQRSQGGGSQRSGSTVTFTGISAAVSDTDWIWLMSIGPYGQKGVVSTIRISASSGVKVTSRSRSRSS